MAGRKIALASRGWCQKTLPGLWLLTLVGACIAAPPGTVLPEAGAAAFAGTNAPLTSVAQVLELSPEQAKAGPPVRLRGIVTCYEHGVVLFVQDETAGVYVYYTGDRLPLRPGQYVEITGQARAGRYSPIVIPEKIQPRESGPVVHPKEVSLARIYLGALDAQWVEFTGVIRSQKIDGGQLTLELADPSTRINVWILNDQGRDAVPLVGSVVRVRGVVGARVSDDGQLKGFQVFANSPSDIAMLQPGPADLFSVPRRFLHDLSAHFAREDGRGLVRVQGVVTLHWPGRALFIQDTTGSAEVQTAQPIDGLAPGTAVEVAGFLGSIPGPTRIEDALVRTLGTNAPPQPRHLSSDDLFRVPQDGQLVEIEASFLGQASGPSNCVALALQAGSRLLTGLLDTSPSPGPLAALVSGSHLRVTGVIHPSPAGGTETDTYLLLRSPADLKILYAPAVGPGPGLRALEVTSILASAGLAAALWLIWRQRRRTERMLQFQTALQAEMRQGEQQLRRSMEERERIGRDLHDDIIQSIYAVGLNIEDCRRVVRTSPGEAEPRLAAAVHTLNSTIRSVRGFIAGLEPKVLNGHEFKTALKSLALTSGDGPAHFHIEVDPAAANRLTSAHATQLLHIAKEAMSNSLRHAQASGVVVSLHPVTAGVCLEVRDDGVGFDPGSVAGGGQGLRNMTSRAREIGADLQMFSAPGEGCRILITIPQRNANESD